MLALACSIRLNVTVFQPYIIIDAFQATVFLKRDGQLKKNGIDSGMHTQSEEEVISMC